MAKNLPTNRVFPKVVLINADSFCFGVYTDDTRGETLLEFLGILWGNRFRDGYVWKKAVRGSRCVL